MGISKKKIQAMSGGRKLSYSGLKDAQEKRLQAAYEEEAAKNVKAQKSKGIVEQAAGVAKGLGAGLVKGGASAISSLASLGSSVATGKEDTEFKKKVQDFNAGIDKWSEENNANQIADFVGNLPGGMASGFIDPISYMGRGIRNTPEMVAASIAAGSKDSNLSKEGIKRQKEIQENQFTKEVSDNGEGAMALEGVSRPAEAILNVVTGGKGSVVTGAAKKGAKDVIKTAIKAGAANVATDVPISIAQQVARGQEVTPGSVAKDALIQGSIGATLAGASRASAIKSHNKNIDIETKRVADVNAKNAETKARLDLEAEDARAYEIADEDFMEQQDQASKDEYYNIQSNRKVMRLNDDGTLPDTTQKRLPEGERTIRTPEEVSTELTEVTTGSGRYAKSDPETRKTKFAALQEELVTATENAQRRDFVINNDLKTNRIASPEEIDIELEDIKSGNIPDDLKQPHPEIENIAQIAVSPAIPADTKAMAGRILEESGIVDRKLGRLMTRDKYNKAHRQMDDAYKAQAAEIMEMPGPRKEIEQQRLDQQYTKDLDELEAKYAEDAQDVERFTTIRERLALKEKELILKANNAIASRPDLFTIPNEDAVNTRVEQLERTKKLNEVPTNRVTQTLTNSVENGILPSESTNPATQQALKDAKVGMNNSMNSGTEPGLVEVYAGVPREVFEKAGGDMATVGRLLDDSYDAMSTADGIMRNKIVDWNTRAGKQAGMEKIARALDGDIDTFASLDANQKQVYLEIQGMFKEYAAKLGLKEEQVISHYLPHIFKDRGVDKIDSAMMQLAVGKNLEGKTLTNPEIASLQKTISGLSYDTLAMVKEKSLYTIKNGFLEKRTGVDGYSFDLANILHTYTKAAHETIYMKPAFDEVKNISKGLSQNQKVYTAKVVQAITGKSSSELGAMLDVTLKQFLPDKNITYENASAKVRNMIYNATLGYNIGSATRNLGQGANTYAYLGAKYYGSGLTQAWTSMKHGSALYEELTRNNVLKNKYSDMLRSGNPDSFKSKNERVMWSMFTATEHLNRATAYFGEKTRFLDDWKKANGTDIVPDSVMKSAEKAGREMSRKTQFEFGPMDTPVGMQGTTAKNLIQFQGYNIAQVRFIKKLIVGADDSMFVKGPKGWSMTKEGSIKFARLVGANLLFINIVGRLVGMEEKDMVPFMGDIEDGRIPRSPIIKLLFGDDTGTAGLATLAGGAKDVVLGKEGSLEQLGDDAMSFGSSAAGLLVPAGTQAKKTIEAVDTNMKGFSENKSGNIRFAQDQDAVSQLRSSLFGQYTTDAGQDWLRDGMPTLTEKQTESVMSQNSDLAKRQYTQFYKTIKSGPKRQEAYDKAKEAAEAGNENKARRLIAEYNAQVDNTLLEYYKVQDKLPDELKEYLESKVKIKYPSIK